MKNYDRSSAAIDGFTWGEIERMVHDSVVEAMCESCGATSSVEPDAHNYDCLACGESSCVTSPLIKLGLV